MWRSNALACACVLLMLVACSSSTSSAGSSGEPHWGVQTKTSGCQAHASLPDSACTPGAIFSTATKDMICQSGYAKSVRNVPESEKNQAYAEYGIPSHIAGEYEVDHLVSLELYQVLLYRSVKKRHQATSDKGCKSERPPVEQTK